MKAPTLFPITGLVVVAMSGPAFAEEVDKEKLIEIGKTHYVTCMACHGADGQGLAVGPLKMAPTFTGSKILLGDPEASISAVLKGIAKVDAKYVGIMAPLEVALDDEKVAGVLTYVRSSFGNSGETITPDEVKAVREKLADRKEMFQRSELEKLAGIEEGEGAEAEEKP